LHRNKSPLHFPQELDEVLRMPDARAKPAKNNQGLQY